MASGIVIVLLPADAVGNEHVTLVYAGEEGAPTMSRYVAEQISSTMARMMIPVMTTVKSHETFGPADDYVPVAELEVTAALSTMRYIVEDYSASQFGFKPHVTADGAPVRAIGSQVVLDRVALWWAGEKKSWRLGSGVACAA